MQVRLPPWHHQRWDGYWYVHNMHSRALGGIDTLGPFMSERLALAHVGRLRRLEATAGGPGPVMRADGSGVFCEQEIGEAEYRRFQIINDDHPELTTALNEMGHANWTVCPLCHVDDFVHVEGCRLLVADKAGSNQ